MAMQYGLTVCGGVRMIGCDQTVTLVHHVRSEEDTYICHAVKDASWFARTTVATSGDGAKPVNSYEVRIFDGLEGHVPDMGDYCVKGEINGVEKPSDLKGKEYFRITSIGFNQRGILAHWRLSGQ